MSKNSSSGMVKVSSVAVLWWNVRNAVSAMVLSTPAMDNDVAEGGGFIYVDAHGQGSGEATRNWRSGGAELVCPTDGWCVITPGGNVNMTQCGYLFKD